MCMYLLKRRLSRKKKKKREYTVNYIHCTLLFSVAGRLTSQDGGGGGGRRGRIIRKLPKVLAWIRTGIPPTVRPSPL